jgi:spermidine/putrescine transport system substrate-binding protein
VAGEPALFPPPEALERLEMLRDLEPKQRRLMSRLWTEIKVR